MRALITGGAGFIGANLAAALARAGATVWLVDSLTREGSVANLRRLLEDSQVGPSVRAIEGDVRDRALIEHAVAEAAPDGVAHLAAQVAVGRSMLDPRLDFEVNAYGTLNVLEAVRRHAPAARVLYTSTNKVYGTLASVPVERKDTRYVMCDRPQGISEAFNTDPTTPYGCSKLAGDFYTRDYARSFGLATTVFRMSCIYGRWQNGSVDQGWVSWMVSQAITGAPITIYGDGLQVRDLLEVDDLILAMEAVLVHGRAPHGSCFNIGGGPENSLSIWAEFAPLLERLTGREVAVRYAAPRVGDQLTYITDYTAAQDALGWKPHIGTAAGIEEMVHEMTTQGRGTARPKRG